MITVASTGPPLIGGGERMHAGRGEQARSASTGPPLIGGGEASTMTDPIHAALLQRVRR